MSDIFIRAGTPSPAGLEAPVHEVAPDVFRSLQQTETSQGMVATVRPPRFDLADIAGAAGALIVVLCRLQDPGNVGTILRVGEAFGATGCLALQGTAGFYNGKAVRASSGSLFRLAHAQNLDLETTIHALKANGIAVAGTSPVAARAIDEWDWRKPAAVLVGNEGGGLNSEETRACDVMLRIPQSTVESLNSAIATAVTLYEAAKQRRTS